MAFAAGIQSLTAGMQNLEVSGKEKEDLEYGLRYDEVPLTVYPEVKEEEYKALYESLKAKYERAEEELEKLRCEKENIRKTENVLLSCMKTIGSDLYQKQMTPGQWTGSLFEDIEQLKSDYVGKVGEKFMHSICQMCGIESEENGDVNSKDGTYDNKIKNKKAEIKTARRGLKGVYQHESLRNSGCDLYVFVDIAPNHVYITILEKFDLSKRCAVTGRTPHLRKGTGDVYKFDFSDNTIMEAIKKGKAIKIEEGTSVETVREFLNTLVE